MKISNGEIRPSQLQQCIAEYPSCNDTNYNIGTWSLQKATAVTTLLAQWRRLKYEPKRLQNCLARCTQAQSKVVLKLFQLDPGLSRAMPQDGDPQTITKKETESASFNYKPRQPWLPHDAQRCGNTITKQDGNPNTSPEREGYTTTGPKQAQASNFTPMPREAKIGFQWLAAETVGRGSGVMLGFPRTALHGKSRKSKE